MLGQDGQCGRKFGGKDVRGSGDIAGRSESPAVPGDQGEVSVPFVSLFIHSVPHQRSCHSLVVTGVGHTLALVWLGWNSCLGMACVWTTNIRALGPLLGSWSTRGLRLQLGWANAQRGGQEAKERKAGWILWTG